MNGYLSGEIEIPEKYQNKLKSVSKRMKNFKCNFCEKNIQNFGRAETERVYNEKSLEL